MRLASSKVRAGLVANALFLASNPAVTQVAAPMGGTARGDVAAWLDQHLTRAERFGFAGAVVVERGGEVILNKAYGLADREGGKRVTAETVFDIGSITKPFTASAILKLADQGKLRAGDSITRFLDNVPADKKAITIHHLLTHTSGLQNGFGGDYELISRDSLVGVVLASKLQSVPGANYEYSNVGYSLLGAIIEKASGLPYEKYLREHVLLPAGATSTGYRSVDWADKPFAVGYRGSGRLGTPLEQLWADDGPSWHLRANGGLLSTAGDLYRWLAAFHGHQIVSPAMYEKATKPPDGSEYGYGWGVGKLANGKRFIGHNGSNGYFYARAVHVPDDTLTIVFLTNDQANRIMENDLLAIATDRQVQQIPDVVRAEVSLARYAGRYRTGAGVEFDLRATAEGLEMSRAPAAVVAPLILTVAATPQKPGGLDSVITRTVAEMAVGNYTSYRARFWPFRDYRIDGETEFWTEVFTDWRDSYGEYRSTEILGSTESGTGDAAQLTTYVAVKYANGERVMRILQPLPPTGKFFAATVSSAQWPTRFVMVPRSAVEFVTYNLELRKSAALTFELDTAGSVIATTLPGGMRAEKIGGPERRK